MSASHIDLVELTTAHLQGALVLSQQAQWPHRIEDWMMVHSLSRGVAAVKDGRVVGTAMATLYGTDAATINMVIVDEAMRGLGIGKRLMDFTLEASQGRECRLVATQDGLPLYEKLGFRETGRILQHQGNVHAVEEPAGVTWAQDSDVADCCALDKAACGMDRSNLIGWLASNGRIAVLRQDDHITGFGIIRAFGRGEVIGPVVAENSADARKILSFFFCQHTGNFLRVDTTHASGIAPWLNDVGLAHVGGGIAMAKNAHPVDNTSAPQTFALASQALG